MGSPTAPTTNVKYRPKLDDTEQRLTYKIAAALTTGLGLGGSDYFADAVAHTGDWLILQAVSDAVLASVTYKPGTHVGSLAGATIKAGDRIYGEITAVQLTSGSVMLYRPTI